jgi:hypothetical protein
MACHCDYCEQGFGSYCTTEEIDRLNAKIAELEGALEEIDEPLSDAWALSVDYDGFKEAESLKSLIDDIIVQVQKGRDIARTARKGRK